MTDFLYRYIFRVRIGVLLFAAAVLALIACNPAKEERLKLRQQVVWKQFIGDPSADMMRYRLGAKSTPPVLIQKEKKR